MQQSSEKLELVPISEDVTGQKAGSGKQRTPVRESDTTATIAKLSVLYGLSEGVVRGFGTSWTESDLKKRVYLDGTPIMSPDGTQIHDVEVEFRPGTIDQTAIEGMPSVTVETVIGVEVRNGNPVARSFQRREVNSYDVRISIPRLMRNTMEGDSYKHTVEFAIDVASDSGSFSEYGRYKITEKISQGFQRTYNVAMPAGNNRTIRLRKISSDGDNSMTFNSIMLEAITEIVEVKLRYPHTALLWLSYDARNFSSAPKVEVLLDGKADIKIPMNYDPDARTYATSGSGTTNGVWNGQFKEGYTDNPVWHWYDLATNKRYGLGNKISLDIPNKFYLYSLAKYCDELVPDGKGGFEPRFTCNNLYLQKQADAFTVFKDLSSIFRAKTIWDGTHLTPKMDAPRDAMLVFSRANANKISYSSTSDAAQHNVISVQFYDTENHYESKFAYARSVENIQRRGRVEQVEVTALGCTSEGQAQRAANYLLSAELTETEIVTFETGLDGIRPVVGDVFIFADDLMAGKATSGRIVAVDGKNVTLDRELDPVLDINGTFIVNTTESLASTRKVTAISADKKTVTLDAAVDVVDITGLVWALKSNNVGLREFTLDDIQYNAEEHTFTVTGVLYNRNKYNASDNAARIEAPPITIIEPFNTQAPSIVTATYNVVVAQGINVCNIELAWGQVTTAAKYEVEMRRDGGEWKKLGTVQTLTMTLDNAYSGLYEFRVRAFDVRGNASVYTTSDSLLVAGKVLPPPVLSEFSLQSGQFSVRADWNFPPNTADTRSTRIQVAFEDPALVPTTTVTTYDVAYPTSFFELSGLHNGIDVWARAAIVDAYGVDGAYTGWRTATVQADVDMLMDVLAGQFGLPELSEELASKIIGAENDASEALEQADTVAGELAAMLDTVGANSSAIQSVQAIVGGHTSQINAHTGRLDNAELGISQNVQAINGVTTRLDSAEGTLSSHTTMLSSINSTIPGLATQTSLDALQGQVSANANGISVLSNSVTSLSATIGGIEIGGTNLLQEKQLLPGVLWQGVAYPEDTELYYYDPNYYLCKLGQKFVGTYYSNNGITPVGATGYIEFYTDNQVYISSEIWIEDGIYESTYITAPATARFFRYSTIGKGIKAKLELGTIPTDWSPSPNEVDIDTSDFASADAVNNLTVRVSDVEGTVTSYAGSITNLNSRLGAAETTVSAVASSVDGINGKYTIKIDNNGYVSGYGLISTNNNGTVTSAFKVNADAFSVGKGTSSIVPFIVTTAGQTVDGIVYPSAGVWINSAYIANASIKIAKIDIASIESLSALSANLGTLVTYKDPSQPNKARMVLTGSLITVYDDNNIVRVRLGLW